jgi:hypothetical protein
LPLEPNGPQHLNKSRIQVRLVKFISIIAKLLKPTGKIIFHSACASL